MNEIVLDRSAADRRWVESSSEAIRRRLGAEVAVAARTNEWRLQSLAILIVGMGAAWLLSMVYLASFLTFA